MSFFSESYLGKRVLPSPDFRITPLSAASLKGLPAHTVILADRDPLHDEGVLFAQRLKEAGGTVRVHVARNAVHGFFTWAFTRQANEAFAVAVEGLTRK